MSAIKTLQTHDLDQLAALISKIALGDQSAFKEFYESTSGAAYALALKMMGRPASAQDLVQESYMRVWANSTEYRSDKGNGISWLLGIVRYRALDALRASNRRDRAMGSHQTEFDVSSVVGSPQSDEGLMLCLEKLGGSQRESILQTFVYGWTYQELATQLSKPIATVKSRIRRGLALLRECLDK
ncbi:MAG: RNA polymerase sigma-70 factor (ECF subfamily) [Arenicella sp.]|jgi:RNA polymerase sigma-70 factor (ECF subfamily)